jgi:WD40 repeat protein
MQLGSTIGGAAWSGCESVIRRFEGAWRGRERPDIAAFLEPASPHPVRLLVELVHIDMEFRLRASEEARVEEYTARFPGLDAPEVVLDLLVAEFVLRKRHGRPARPEEYWLRYPQHVTELRVLLPAEGGSGALAPTRPVGRASAPLSGPPVIAGYEIEGELGRGGMGVVYKARDLLLHRTVAVKTFGSVPHPESCARFAREAEAIARLDHPHIVPVYEVGEWRAGQGPPVPYFAMKWYPGGSLDEAPTGPGTVPAGHARVVETIARAVHHAHQRGILHRDLKPSNILLDDAGLPHVADFGLAGRVDPDAPTLTAVVAGTPAYMAPEQESSPQTVSTAADVYGLGAILYHQLTGRPPFEAETPLATLALVASRPPARPSAVNPAVPRDLDTICLKCLEKEPARRYASAAELAEDLQRWRSGFPIAARPARTWERAWRLARRHPVVTALVLTTVAALVGAVAVLSVSNELIREKEQETQGAYLRECAMRYRLEEALARDRTTRLELEETLRRELRALYLERVSSAGRLYASNQLAEAWTLLDQCPEQYRGWEWRYLDARRRAQPVTLRGHAGSVTKVGHLADGRLISADPMGAVRTWSASTRQCEWTWTFSSAPITALAVHPTKNWAALADHNGVSVWSADARRTITRLPGASWVAFSPDGTRVATSDNTAIWLWTVPDAEPTAQRNGTADRGATAWKPAGELTGHPGGVLAGTFTPDGTQLITSGQDRTIRTWDLETGKRLSSRDVPVPVTGLALASGGKVLAEARVGTVLFTERASGRVIDRLEYPTGERTAVASSPDDHSIAAGGAGGEVVVWDTLQRRTTRVFRGHSGAVRALAFEPDGHLVSGGTDQTVRVWDASREAEVRTLARVGEGVGGLALAPDGSRIAVDRRLPERRGEATTHVIDAASGRELYRLTGGPDIGFLPTSGRLVTGRAGGGAVLWDPVTGRTVWNKPFFTEPDPPPATDPGGRRLALAPDGALLAVWDRRAAGIRLWSAADGTETGWIDTGAYINALEFSPDGSRLVAAAPDALLMWDVASRAQVHWGEDARGASTLAFSPNGQWLATVDRDRTVRLRDAATGRAVRNFIGSTLRADVLAFSPDSARLATGGADRTVRVWDVESGRELLALLGATGAVTGIAWDATRDRICALDDAVRLWETKDH